MFFMASPSYYGTCRCATSFDLTTTDEKNYKMILAEIGLTLLSTTYQVFQEVDRHGVDIREVGLAVHYQESIDLPF